MIVTYTQSIVDRFMDKVIPEPMSGCWLWGAACDRKGYGMFNIVTDCGHKLIQFAHRISWEIHNDEIPKNICVLHKCDIPGCVNPDHLFLGSRKDNAEDMVKKGRSLRGRPHGVGSDNTNARLTEEDVMVILCSSLSQKKIARLYGVSQAHVSRIKTGKAWSSITGREYKCRA